MENNKANQESEEKFYVTINGKKYYKPCCSAAIDDFIKDMLIKFGSEGSIEEFEKKFNLK